MTYAVKYSIKNIVTDKNIASDIATIGSTYIFLFLFKMVEAEGVEPSSTAAKIRVIHKHSWFVFVIPTKLGSYNLSLTALLQ